MAVNISLNTLLNRITPKVGLPFPGKSQEGDGVRIASAFPGGSSPAAFAEQVNAWGRKITRIDDTALGRYVFMPVSIDGYDLPNPLIMITGEKAIIETDLTEVGTVFEKAYMRPYDIQILVQLQGENRLWPERQFKEVTNIWKGADLVRLDCALTDYFLVPSQIDEHSLNFLVTKISVLDNAGSESTEFIQLEGRSNIEFELEIK